MGIQSDLFSTRPWGFGYSCLGYENELEEVFDEFPYHSLHIWILYIAFCWNDFRSL